MPGYWKYTTMEPVHDFDQLLKANLPDGALRLPLSGSGTAVSCSGSGEDKRLQAARKEALQRGTTAPLVKEELRQQILLRRIRDGKPELKPDITPPKKYKLTPAEKAKKERRREQNRRAAKRCRDKKKNQESNAVKTFQRTQRENERLKKEVGHLQHYHTSLQHWLLTHLTVCSVRLPSPLTPEQPAPQQQQPQQHQHLQQQLQQQQLLQQQQQQQPLWPEPHLHETSQEDQLQQREHESWQKEGPASWQEQPQQQQQPPWQPPQSGHQLQPHQQQHHQQQQQQQQSGEPASPVPGVMTPESVMMMMNSVAEAEQPSLGSQGFETLCQGLQGQDLVLNTQELTDLLTTPTTPTPGPNCAPAEAFNTSPIQSGSLTTSAAFPSPGPQIPQPVQPSQSDQQFQPTPPSPKAATSTPSGPESEDVIPDLPGFPFSMQRKRKSADSRPQSRDGRNEQGKMLKSATYPLMGPTTGEGSATGFKADSQATLFCQPVSFALGGASEVGRGSGTIFTSTSTTCSSNINSRRSSSTYPDDAGCERGSSAPLSPFLPLPRNPSPFARRGEEGGYSSTPSPSPSPRSPCCFRFSSVTPPPRSSCIPQSPSPVTPPPPSSLNPHRPCSTSPHPPSFLNHPLPRSTTSPSPSSLTPHQPCSTSPLPLPTFLNTHLPCSTTSPSPSSLTPQRPCSTSPLPLPTFLNTHLPSSTTAPAPSSLTPNPPYFNTPPLYYISSSIPSSSYLPVGPHTSCPKAVADGQGEALLSASLDPILGLATGLGEGPEDPGIHNIMGENVGVDDAECLSSYSSFQDLLQDGLMSSQEE